MLAKTVEMERHSLQVKTLKNLNNGFQVSAYDAFFEYLSKRDRFGVVGNANKMVKYFEQSQCKKTPFPPGEGLLHHAAGKRPGSATCSSPLGRPGASSKQNQPSSVHLGV